MLDVPGGQKKYELDSTLVGGACKLLVTGGAQPELSSQVILTGGGGQDNTLGASYAGAPDQDLGYERLGRLLLYTYTQVHQNPATREDLISILALNAQELAIDEWGVPFIDMQERVRRTFAEYGFGRSKDYEQNSATEINSSILDNAPRNLIAVGKRYSQAIEGTSSSCTDEDFFILNERVTIGDTVHFEVTSTLSSGPIFEVRFYQENSCHFDNEQCSILRQEYPEPTPDGSTVYGGDPPGPKQSGDFFWKAVSTGGGVPGGGSAYRRVFVGVRLFANSCNAPYELVVDIKRTGSLADPYP